jgi:hypothetical protein
MLLYRYDDNEIKQKIVVAQRDLEGKYLSQEPHWLTGEDVRFHPVSEKSLCARRRKRVLM